METLSIEAKEIINELFEKNYTPRDIKTAYEEMEKRYADGWYNSIAKAGVYRVGNDFFYRWWKIYPEMPEGYFEDKNSGSPLSRTVFIINGSPIRGGKRALLYVK